MTIIKILEVLIFSIFAEKIFEYLTCLYERSKISKIKYRLIPKSCFAFGVSDTNLSTSDIIQKSKQNLILKLISNLDTEAGRNSMILIHKGKISEGVIYTSQSFF